MVEVLAVEVTGASHFSVLGPVNALIAGKISADTGRACHITIPSEEATRLFGR